MKYLFVHSNMKFFESLAFTNTLYAFDFDGTLSKTAKHPDQARIAPKTKKLLSQLSRMSEVAIISGRGLKDLKARLNLDGVALIGNHGIEGFGIANSKLDQISAICKDWYKALLMTWVQEIRDPYVSLENKTYSLSLHYRRSRRKKVARKAALRAIANLVPNPRIVFGKCVINIMPENSPHKGNAIMKLLEQKKSRKVFYIGDDHTDESVFGMNDIKVFSVRVGKNRNSKALFYIKNQSQINKLLSVLIKVIASKKINRGQSYEQSSYAR